MSFKEETDFDRFVSAFVKRYGDEMNANGIVVDDKIRFYWLYLQFRDSGLSPEQWLEQQEYS